MSHILLLFACFCGSWPQNGKDDVKQILRVSIMLHLRGNKVTENYYYIVIARTA